MALALVGVLFGGTAGLARADPLEVAVQDNRMIFDASARPYLIRYAHELGATVVRMHLMPGDSDRANAAVDDLVAAGLTPELNLTWPRYAPAPTPAEFSAWVGDMARGFQGRVHRWSIWNEPNCCHFLVPTGQQCATYVQADGDISPAYLIRVPRRYFLARRVRIRRHGRWSWVTRPVFVRRRVRGRWRRVRVVRYRWALQLGKHSGAGGNPLRACTPNDQAREYRALYDAGYGAVKAVDPRATVLTGELAGHHAALDFMTRVALAGGGPVIADGIGVHPYRDTWYDGRDVITDTNVVRTPQGGVAPTYVTENGEFSRPTEGSRVGEVDDDATRARKLTDLWALACATPGVRRQTQYQLIPSHGTWDTSILDEEWNPDPAFLALRAWIAGHPECIAQP